MEKKSEDRRVKMTKRLLKDALLELLERRELSDISVTALCNAADVHRSTFYKYYTDPGDLLKTIEQDILDHIPVPEKKYDNQTQKQLLVATTAFFDFARDNKKAFRILFGKNSGGGFFARLVNFLCDGYVFAQRDTDDLTADFVKYYIANGTVGMLKKWVLSDFPLESHRIAEMMYFFSKKVVS